MVKSKKQNYRSYNGWALVRFCEAELETQVSLSAKQHWFGLTKQTTKVKERSNLPLKSERPLPKILPAINQNPVKEVISDAKLS